MGQLSKRLNQYTPRPKIIPKLQNTLCPIWDEIPQQEIDILSDFKFARTLGFFLLLILFFALLKLSFSASQNLVPGFSRYTYLLIEHGLKSTT